ncbi:MAG: SMP-30/gluconolactonase/LRE family protein [Rhodothermales bacterium]|nr:SMP-30/gluconolactonase/LRE family protein [Rhodothermales bacterium]
MRKTFAALIAGGVLYLLLWPVPVDPVAWQPPASHAYPPNTALEAGERIDLPDGHGPEDVAVDSLGRIYAGLADGRLVRLAPDGTGMEELAHTGGHPLGLDFGADGTLYVADAFEGLLALEPGGPLRTLTTEAGGVPFRFTDDVDVGPDGTVYFTDASSRFGQPEYKLDVLESRPHGRLLAWDPATGRTRVLLDSLYFANGVAVAPDGGYLLVNETTRYRTRRYELTGPRAGTSSVVLEQLPGFPDGVAAAADGTFWLTLIAPRNPLVDGLAGQPWLRRVIARLPAFVQPAPARHGFLIQLDGEGRVLRTLQSPSGVPLALISSVEPHGGTLYLGSLEEPALGRFPLGAAE